MIDETTMQAQANDIIRNAPNKDWQERGGCSLTSCLSEESIETGIFEKTELGKATVGFYQFAIPKDNEFSKGCDFIGFMLAVSDVGGNFIRETTPVIGSVRDGAYKNIACSLSSQFCPNCRSVNTIIQTSKVMGPECVAITYKCPCGYEDHDVMD